VSCIDSGTLYNIWTDFTTAVSRVRGISSEKIRLASAILMFMDSKVIIYSADWCAFCHAAMDYMNKIGVKFEQRNVEHDVKFAQEAVEKSNQTGIPVIDIDGKIIIGFDRPKIDATLKEKKIVS